MEKIIKEKLLEIEESLERVKALAAAAPEARSEWGMLDEYFLRLVEK